MSNLTEERKEETSNEETHNNNAIAIIVHQGLPQVHQSRTSIDNDISIVENGSSDRQEISSAFNSKTIPRVTQSLTTDVSTGGVQPNPRSRTGDISLSPVQESVLEDGVHVEDLWKVWFHEKEIRGCGTSKDESKASSNPGKSSAPRLNLSSNKVAPSPYDRDEKTLIVAIPESEEADDFQTSPISSTSFDSMADVCRICHDNPSKLQLMMPCRCKGSMGMVHLSCLERWLSESGKNTCEICGHEYNTVRKPKYTGLSAMFAWIRQPLTANDTRNLFFDIACFFILTPLAAVSGWLCVSGAQSYTLDNHFYAPRRMADKSEPSNSTWTAVGLLSLTATVAVAYLVWLFIAIRYHRHVFQEWQTRNYIVTILPFDASLIVPIQSDEPPGQTNNRYNAEDANNNEYVYIGEEANNNDNVSELSGRASTNVTPNCADINILEDELVFASVYEKDSMDQFYTQSSLLNEIIINNVQDPIQSSSNRDELEHESSNSSHV